MKCRNQSKNEGYQNKNSDTKTIPSSSKIKTWNDLGWNFEWLGNNLRELRCIGTRDIGSGMELVKDLGWFCNGYYHKKKDLVAYLTKDLWRNERGWIRTEDSSW